MDWAVVPHGWRRMRHEPRTPGDRLTVAAQDAREGAVRHLVRHYGIERREAEAAVDAVLRALRRPSGWWRAPGRESQGA